MKQLITFFSLSYLTSWIIWLPLYGHIFGLTNLPYIPFNHALGGLGPLMAAVLSTCIHREKEGLRQLLKQCVQAKPLVYLAIALFSPFMLAALAGFISHFVNKSPLGFSGFLSSKEFPGWNISTIFIYNLLFFGFGEEVGWRGFALPRLQSQLSPLVSGLTLTLFWALWHWPLFLYRPGYTAMDMAGITGWLMSLLTGSILLTWLFNSSRGSILICAVFHATIDVAFTADYTNNNMVGYLGFLITVWGILAAFTLKRKLSSGSPKSKRKGLTYLI